MPARPRELCGLAPLTGSICEFIADHRDRFGVAPICRVLSEHGVPIAPSTFYARIQAGAVEAGPVGCRRPPRSGWRLRARRARP